MTDNTANDNAASENAATDTDPASMPVRLVRGDPSPDETYALVAVVAVLAAASGDGDEGQAGGQAGLAAGHAPSQWSTPSRMVRASHPHGPGGWRASAAPR